MATGTANKNRSPERLHFPKAECSLKRYRYVGKERDDESGFIYIGARYYCPWLARWLEVDPINNEWHNMNKGVPQRNRERDFMELTCSSYEYCYANPVRFIDPNGEQVTWRNDEATNRRMINEGKNSWESYHSGANLTVPAPVQEILRADVYGKGHMGPESEVNSNVNYINTEYYNQVGANIAGGPFGALGYMLGGNEGSFKGSAIDQAMVATVALGDLKSNSGLRQMMTKNQPETKAPARTSNSESLTISNKLPLQKTGKLQGIGNNGNIEMIDNTRLHGNFDFVIDKSNTLLIGRSHSFLSGGSDVQAAGTVRFRNGQIVRIDNASGHYTPTVTEGKTFLKTFQNIGFNIDRAHLQLLNENCDFEIHITPNSTQRNSFLR